MSSYDDEGVEIEVTATSVLEKKSVLVGQGTQTWRECETEPDGSRSYTTITESADDVRDLWDNQELKPLEIFARCRKIIQQLEFDLNVRFYAGYCLQTLLDAIEDWEEVEWTVYER